MNQKKRMNQKIFKKGSYFGQLNLTGLQDGYGLMMFSNGSVYKGTWKNGLKQGRGQMIFNNGDFYQGEFNKNKFEGTGEYFFAKTQDSYKGKWVEGKMQGNGVYWNDVKQTTFRGAFYENKKHGNGVTLHENYTLSGFRNLGVKEGVFYLRDKLEDCTHIIKYERNRQVGVITIKNQDLPSDEKFRISDGFGKRERIFEKMEVLTLKKRRKTYSCGEFAFCFGNPVDIKKLVGRRLSKQSSVDLDYHVHEGLFDFQLKNTPK